MSGCPSCQLSIFAAAVLLSPMFAFLTAIAVEILIGSQMAAAFLRSSLSSLVPSAGRGLISCGSAPLRRVSHERRFK